LEYPERIEGLMTPLLEASAEEDGELAEPADVTVVLMFLVARSLAP